MTEIGSNRISNDPGLRKYFCGAYGLRSGWRLLIFIGILAILFRVNSQLLWPMMHGLDEVIAYLARDVVDFLDFLLASWIMAKIEKRTIADYGLPWRRMFRGQFWQGALIGFASLTTLLVVMRAMGIFYFGKIALHGAESLQFAGLYGLAFLIVGVKEEFHYRGYGLFVLSKGVGFWLAALLTAAFFGYSHSGNSGENWLGLFNASAGGLFFCFLLRRTGNLWMPIGFHLAWDWGQTFFYGVPDSGIVLPGHLFNPSISGPAWLTGGSVGPEGSVLCLPFLAVVGFILSRWLRETKYPGPDAAL
jgi:membrane protease YdiL (CAAX protease family)